MSNLNDPTAPDFEAIASGIAEETPLEENPNTQGLLTKEQFFELFKGTFSISSSMTQLKSLSLEQDEAAGRAASDAIYDTAAEVEAFRFLIQPSNVWMQRGFVVLAFTIPKMQSVNAEVKERRMARIIEQRNAEYAQAAAHRAAMPTPAPHPAFSSGAQDPLSPNFGAGLNA